MLVATVFIVAARLVNRLPNAPPREVAPATTARDIRPTIRPYSNAFEPESSLTNFFSLSIVFPFRLEKRHGRGSILPCQVNGGVSPYMRASGYQGLEDSHILSGERIVMVPSIGPCILNQPILPKSPACPETGNQRHENDQANDCQSDHKKLHHGILAPNVSGNGDGASDQRGHKQEAKKENDTEEISVQFRPLVPDQSP